MSLNVVNFGAIRNGVSDDTAAIQSAHDLSVASGLFTAVVFPEGRYKFSTLNWSPHVQAVATGKVSLETSNPSGRTINISDEYGRPATYGVNSLRNATFSGQFLLINTDVNNTATAWSFGGSSSGYFCNICTPLSGVQTWRFHGAALELRNNAFLLEFRDCFVYICKGAQIKMANDTTNTGEGIRFSNCTFGGAVGGTVGYLLDINTPHAVSMDFIGCSADYLPGLNKPGNSAPLLAVNWDRGHLEWEQVAAPYLVNDGGSTWNIDGAAILPAATSGWPAYTISLTSGNGTTRFTNIKYVIPGAVPCLHRVDDSTARGVFDYTPNYQNGNVPIAFLSYAAGSVIGYDGVTMREIVGDIPTWSGTLGNGTLTRTYTRVGNRVDVWIRLVWGSTTTHPAATQTFGLPYAANASAGGLGSWWANDFGTGNRTGTARVTPGGAAALLYDDQAALLVTNTAPITWAENDEINLCLTYFV